MDDSRINPGEFDTRVTVQSVVQSRGDEGQKLNTYANFRDVYAKVSVLTDEGVADDNYEESTTISVQIYKIQELTARWRLVIDGIPYEIISIDQVSRLSPFQILTAQSISR